MVKWKDSIAALCQKPSLELMDIRLNLFNLLQKPGLPADLLSEVFYWKGVIDSELQLRACGERRQRHDGAWEDRSPGGNDLT